MPVYRKIAFFFPPFFSLVSPWTMTPLHTHWKKKKKIRRPAKKGEGESLRAHLIQRQSVPKIAEITHIYFIRGHVINLLFLFAMGTWALHSNMFFSLPFFVRSLFGNILSQRCLSLFIMVRRLRKPKEGPSPSSILSPLPSWPRREPDSKLTLEKYKCTALR